MILLKNFEIRSVYFTKTTLLQRVPVTVNHRSSSQPKIEFRALIIAIRLQHDIFHFPKLLGSQSNENVTWKIIFDLSCMISQKNFEIRIALYENDLVANGTCHNQSSQFPARHKIQFTA